LPYGRPSARLELGVGGPWDRPLRDREFVADFAAERLDLSEAKVVRVAGHAPADEARLGGHELDVRLVPGASDLGQVEHALVDASRQAGPRRSLPERLPSARSG
jgi:hypothetical protein